MIFIVITSKNNILEDNKNWCLLIQTPSGTLFRHLDRNFVFYMYQDNYIFHFSGYDRNSSYYVAKMGDVLMPEIVSD